MREEDEGGGDAIHVPKARTLQVPHSPSFLPID